MTLLLNNDEVDSVLSMGGCVEALRQLFRDLAQGGPVTRPRTETWVPSERHSAQYMLKSMEGAVPSMGVCALRLTSTMVAERTIEGVRRRELLPAGPNGQWVGLILLFSLDTCHLVAVMPDGYLQRMRVGATYALAAERMSRPESSRVGILGSGWQAGAQLMGLRCVRPVQEVKVYSPTPEHRRAFAREMTALLGAPVIAVESAREAVTGADLVVACTNANEPVLSAEWLSPGAHLCAINGREMGIDAFERCDVVATNHQELWLMNFVPGSRQPVEAPGSASFPVDPARRVDALDVLTGRVAGRRSPQDITFFTNEASNVQIGAGFAAVAARAYELALERELGRQLPDTWFTQSLHP